MPVLAMRILTFSILFGWFTPIFLSNRKPGDQAEPLQQPIREQHGGYDNITQSLTFVQVGVGEAAAQLLDDVNGLQVAGSLQPHDGVHGELGEVGFVVSQQFGGQRCPSDVQQVFLETGWVVAMEMGRMEDTEKILLFAI